MQQRLTALIGSEGRFAHPAVAMTVMLVLAGILATLGLELPSNHNLLWMYPLCLLLEIALITGVLAGMFFLTQRRAGLSAFFALAFFILGVAEYFVITFKSMPITPGDMTAISTAAAVAGTGYTYTLSPQSPPEGEDFVTWFLTEGREGYCVHFATAAVALFRSAGIPARYAEGYAVPSGYDGLWVDVPDYNAHAWVEVYTGGTGWLPVEVTPAGPEAPAAYLNAQREVKLNGVPPVPLHLRNATTQLQREWGYGKDYKYPHNYPEGYVEQAYLPDEVQGRRFYQPKDCGDEARLSQWWRRIHKIHKDG